MTLLKFFQDAIEGGCDNAVLSDVVADLEDVGYAQSWYTSGGLLLLPEVWEAVGKKRGWKSEYYCPCCKNERHCAECECDEKKLPEWRYRQHDFIDNLQDGMSTQQAIDFVV